MKLNLTNSRHYTVSQEDIGDQTYSENPEGKMNLLKWVKLSLMVSMLLGGLALPAFSATQTVSSTADSGAGSLRLAITNATAGDTVVFNLTYPATITLSSTLSIAKNLSIKGPGVASLTINGNNAVRVFDITAGTITISDLTISNGRSAVASETGAGIRLGGLANLTLDRCKINNCSLNHSMSSTYGGGISVAATATLTVLRSYFYQNSVPMGPNLPPGQGYGGAIDNLGTLTVVDSTFEGNSAYQGGALHERSVGKVVTLEGCTFSGNTSDNQGVVAHFGNSSFNVINCTITKNYSTNGSNSWEAGLSVYNNSGIPTPGGTFTLKNTVVAGNVATTGGGDSDIYFDPTGLYSGGITFTFISGGYNLIGSVGSNDAYYTWGTGDVRGTEGFPQNASLANLVGNGGYVSSHLPNAGSLAINPVSSNGSVFVDGRGYLRAGATSEKGATEYLGTLPVATAASGITGSGFSANWNTVTGATGYLLDVATDTAFTAMVTGYRGLDVGNLLTYSVTGLSAGTTYYYRVRGYSGLHHTYYTNTVSVTTTNPPTATTGTATSITSTGTTLNGTVNANGYSSTVTFDYGLTTGYGSSITASQSPVSGASNTAVSAAVSGLTCNTTYHFRAKGISTGGTSNGSDATFTTGACNAAPTDIALSASSIDENVIANTTVGTLSTTDPDGGTFSYTLVSGAGSTDNASFNISGSSLRITSSPNYEVKNSYSVRIRSTDQSGLYFEKPFAIAINDLLETPVIFSISQPSGPAAGGTSVTLTGTSFTGTTGVTFGGAAATNVIVVSDTQITLSTPAGTGSNNSVVVKSPGGFSSGTTLFTYIPAPTVSSILPASGSPLGGTTVTISGTDFTGATSVTIGGSAAAGITVVNATTITATTPVGTLGVRDVAVTTPGGTGTGAGLFTYNSTPTDISFSASSIDENVAANSTVGTLSTTDPDAGNTFTYTLVSGTGSTDNASFNISVDNLRITNSPNYEVKSSYSVRVRSTDQGGLYFEKAFTITINDLTEVPVITGISPSSGTAAGGTSVTITGTSFTGTTGVTIGGAAASNVVVVSDSQITLTTPAGTGPNNSVVVTSPGGISSEMIMFTYIPVPTVTTDAVSGVTTSAATMNGTVNANNADSTVCFEYGATASYGSGCIAASPATVSGVTNTPVSLAVSGLTALTTYHFRAVASSLSGTTNGADQTFTTAAALAAPAITSANSASWNYGVGSSFTVNATGNPTAALKRTGALPAGVSFHDNGNGTATISGTPNVSGSFAIFIIATNSQGNANQSFTMTVAAAANISSLSALDTAIAVSPDRHLFGVVAQGSCSGEIPFTVTNRSAASVTFGTVGKGGNDAAEYTISGDNCSSQAVAAGASCTVGVKFCPGAATQGSKSAQLEIPHDGMTVTAFLYNHETLQEEAARRIPSVLSALNIPTTIQPGQQYTITWSLLGYDDDYLSRIALFNCAGVPAGTCGDSFASNFSDSGNLPAVSTNASSWSYNGVTSNQFNYSYTFTAPASATDMVIRFYRKTAADDAAGKGSLSLLIPGNLLQSGTEYYDLSGRRLKHAVAP